MLATGYKVLWLPLLAVSLHSQKKKILWLRQKLRYMEDLTDAKAGDTLVNWVGFTSCSNARSMLRASTLTSLSLQS